MAAYFWEGHAVRLRPVRAEDWSLYYAEAQDSEGLRALNARVNTPVSPEAAQQRFREWSEKPGSIEEGKIWFSVETLAGEMVGMANLNSYDAVNGTFSLTIRIFRPFRGCGYAREAMLLILRYGFLELRCQKANSATIDFNEASIRLHQSLGFKIEGRIRQNAFTGGIYHDEILFGLTREEFDAIDR